MRQSTVSRLAWALWVLILLLIVVDLVLGTLSGRWNLGENIIFAGLTVVVGMGSGTVGALIVSRQGGNAIGWLVLLLGLTLVVAAFSESYNVYALRTAPGSLPGVSLVAWFGNWMIVPTVTLALLVFLLYPTGRVPSHRWRPLFWLIVAAGTVAIVGWVIRPGPIAVRPGLHVDNPTGIPGMGQLAGFLIGLGGWPLVVAGPLAVVVLSMRFRRAKAEERQQIKWLAYVGFATAVLFVGTLITGLLGGEEGGVWNDVFFISTVIVLAVGLPMACGIAILKYRLYDLDIVVRKTVVFGILAAFITGAYLLVVIGIPTLLFGAGGSLENAVPFVAAAVLALAFQPVRRAANRLANRVVYGKRATPYELLTEFSGRVGGAYAVEDVLPRVARVIGDGTGAQASSVWLHVGDELRLAAAWPDGSEAPEAVSASDEPPDALPGFDRAFPVRHQGELLGAVAVRMPKAEPLSPTTEKLLEDLAGQAGLIVRNVRLTEELKAKLEELRASRQRLVTAQDEERRRLERNIHDGAQQQLVALAVKLRLVETLAAKDPAKAAGMAAAAKAELQEALEDLRDLARGIYPPLLADKGLAAALESQARKAPIPVSVAPDGIGRYPQEAEAAAYFCVLEALQNAAKYAQASQATVRLSQENGYLVFIVTDDGRGFDPVTTPRGSGLQNMEDRVEALGGTVKIVSAPGRGTTVTGRVPIR